MNLRDIFAIAVMDIILFSILICFIVNQILSYKFGDYLNKHHYHAWDKMTKAPGGMRWVCNRFTFFDELFSNEYYGDPELQNKKKRLRVTIGLQFFSIIAFVVYLILSG